MLQPYIGSATALSDICVCTKTLLTATGGGGG